MGWGYAARFASLNMREKQRASRALRHIRRRSCADIKADAAHIVYLSLARADASGAAGDRADVIICRWSERGLALLRTALYTLSYTRDSLNFILARI